MFFMRQLGTILCFIPLLVLLLELQRPWWAQALLAANAFVWPFAAQYRARRSLHPARAELQNLLADAAAGGFWIAQTALSPLTSVVIATILLADRLAAGGFALMRQAAGMMVLVFGATWLALGLPVTLSVSSRTLYATLPLISVYVLVLSMVSHALSTRLREKTRELERYANTDPLLNIANRRRLEHDIEAALQRFHQSAQPAALMFIDIDDFKAANDRYGHEAGDRLLVMFSEILRGATHAGDTVARFGGDEFVVLLPDTSFGRACAVADRIMAQTAKMDVFPDSALRCTLSIGIARATTEMRGAAQWLKAADDALYSAKREGKNRIYAL
ncbi:diguanylate cyclase [Cronobacter malonaticus]|uniref:sensor domain-containing diguanylate cyclase n=1 Tax=Cronobacter malonaticus TaxID=413503 RepID=UPI000D00EFBF|nr:GGDEF domain-containing protein [Cronobacter malonaticus]ELY4599118.1 diguanylate cyclase AdrA [Cronobacter malonaticus]MEB8677668.1 diguanylate cyclase [Cronobacter malonaticus]